MITAPQPAALLIGALSACATFAGGAIALRLRASLDLLLCFSSGAVIGVALFDLFPEAFSLGRASGSGLSVIGAVAVGFILYLAADGALLARSGKRAAHRGHLGPGSLTAHSFLDGVGIGLAFHVSPSVGVIVAVAVLTHDLVDGANTVTLSLAGGIDSSAARKWLIADALAPLVGILCAQLAPLPEYLLALLLGLFSGFLLYLGASKLVLAYRSAESAKMTLITAASGLISVCVLVSWTALANSRI